MTITVPPPTIEAITSGEITEGRHYDFKETLDLGDNKHKVGLIDDVVAFLNTGAAHIIVGVREEGGRFKDWRPLTGDRDKLDRRIQSILQDSIDPVPTKIHCRFLDIPGGYICDISLPEHRQRPYQNMKTGAYLIRTGAQNRPLKAAEVKAHYKAADQQHDLAAFHEREARRVLEGEIMRDETPLMSVSILPFDRHLDLPPPKIPRTGVINLRAPMFHEGSSWKIFQACEDGHQGIDVTIGAKGADGGALTRYFLGDDWSVHISVVAPFAYKHDHITFDSFKERLQRLLTETADIYQENGVLGPFAIQMRLEDIGKSENVAWAFASHGPISYRPPGSTVENLSDPAHVEGFYDRIRSRMRR